MVVLFEFIGIILIEKAILSPLSRRRITAHATQRQTTDGFSLVTSVQLWQAVQALIAVSATRQKAACRRLRSKFCSPRG